MDGVAKKKVNKTKNCCFSCQKRCRVKLFHYLRNDKNTILQLVRNQVIIIKTELAYEKTTGNRSNGADPHDFVRTEFV